MPAFICPSCGRAAEKPAGAINRAKSIGAPIYCGRICGGLARRKGKTKEQKISEKAAYDMQRRADLADRIKAEKAEYHKRTYDPAKAREVRKGRMPWHAEYCRRPEYVAWKRDYDRQHLARKAFGEFAEVALVLRDIETEILRRASRYEIDLAKGSINKAQNRKRNHVDLECGEPQASPLGNPSGDQGQLDPAEQR